MKLIPYIVYLVLISLHVVILNDLISIYGIGINLTAFLTMMVATSKSETTSLWFGFVAGLVMLAGQPELIGAGALVTALLGLTAFHICKRLNLESLNSKFLLVLIGTALHNIALLGLGSASDFFYLLIVNALPGALYTTILAWVYFLIKEDRLTVQKIKSIF
ncbi:MAG: hypothetical protein U9N55_02230 [candidate division Zixibacteria bacterium]|nr:hypothetical protein [candidate division Zixibacteria bacterium]